MKKELWLTLIVVLMVSVIGCLSWQIGKNRELKELEKIDAKLSFYQKKEILTNPLDELEAYFNNLLVMENTINDLKHEKLSAEDLKDISSTKEKLEKTVISNSIKSPDWSNLLKDYSKKEQSKIKKIYNDSSVALNSQNYNAKIKEYNEDITKDIELLNYLEENKDDFYLKNDSLIYKDEKIKSQVTTYNTDISMQADTPVQIPILMYHGVLDNPYGGKELFVRVSEFSTQMKYLKENGFTPIFLSEIDKSTEYAKPVIITFDDGYKDVYTNAFPILEQYNFKANLYVITDWVGGSVYVTWDDVLKMHNSNLMEIGSHTSTHQNLASLSDDKIETELKKSKETLESKLSKTINTLAYPYGGHNEAVMNIAKKYYDYALSTNSGKEISNSLHQYELNRYNVYRGCSLQTFKSYAN